MIDHCGVLASVDYSSFFAFVLLSFNVLRFSEHIYSGWFEEQSSSLLREKLHSHKSKRKQIHQVLELVLHVIKIYNDSWGSIHLK